MNRRLSCSLLLGVLTLSLISAVAHGADGGAPAGETESISHLQRWLDAQNARDFSAYRGLYGAAFTGIRRSGTRTVELDRGDWMRERERMFRRSMRVSYRLLSVTALGPAQVELRFEQRWRSGRYFDRGEKRMVLAKENGGLTIVREEMLSSEVIGPGTREVLWEGLDDHIPMFVGHPYLVLGSIVAKKDDSFPEDAWAIGPILQEWNRRSFRRLTSRAVDSQRTPAEIQAWVGRKVVLFGADGVKCQTSITGLRMASQTRSEHEEKPSGRRTLPASAWSREDDHYQMREYAPHILLAEVNFLPTCKGSLWARPADRPVPQVIGAQSPQRNLERAAWKAFRQLPEYQKLQAVFEREMPAPRPRFWDLDKDASASLRSVLWFPQGQQGIVVVSADFMTCRNSFEGSLSAVFQVNTEDPRQPTLKLETTGVFDFFLPKTAVDLDGDGRLEFLDGDSVVRWRGKGYEKQTLPEGFLDGC